MSLRSRLLDLIRENPKLQTRTLARRFLKEIPLTELVDALAHEISNLKRGVTRSRETQAFDFLYDETGKIRDNLDLKAFVKEVVDLQFQLADGRRVTWGDATIPDHEEYIQMMEGQIEGMIQTINRHEQAVEICKKQKVNSLRELLRGDTP